MAKTEVKKNRIAYFYYTLLFLAALSTILIWFLRYHKSMVWDCDGLYQHFNSFVYYGKYLRGIIKNLLENHTLSVPMWDMSIGYGADILTTLNYYVMGDPLTLLSVFAFPEIAEYVYGFVVVLRLYLAGAFFLMFCRSHGKENAASLLGTLVYCFSGYGIFLFSRHPFFINPMVYFPLILMGIDRIFKRKSPALFIVMIAVSAISNFYFFYMSCILMFLYAVFVYLKQFGRIRLKELLSWFFKFVGFFAVGVGISMVTLLPVAMNLLSTNRMNTDNNVSLFYPLAYYVRMAGDFFGADYVSATTRYYSVLGFLPLVMVAVFLMLGKGRKYAYLRSGFLLLNVFLMFPVFGYVMNGFSYVSNRWIWGYDMLLAYIVVNVYPEMFRTTPRERWRILALSAVCGAVILMLPRQRTLHNCTAIAMLMVLCAAFVFYEKFPKKGKGFSVFLYGMSLAGIAVNVFFLYSPDRTGVITEFRDKGRPYELLTTSSEFYQVKELEDGETFYRYDQYGITAHENTSMQNRTYSTDFYFSTPNGAVSEYFNKLCVAVRLEQMYDNLDGRAILDRLAGVKYFLVKEGNESCGPYSFDTVASQKGKYTVYQTEEVLPFGYTYAYSISEDAFEEMSLEERQQALLQGAVTAEFELPEAELTFNDKKADISITADENIRLDGNRVEVLKGNAKLTISFEGTADCETYLVLKNLQYEGKVKNFTLKTKMGDAKKSFPIYTNKHSFYSGKKDFSMNMGYSQEAPSQITLSFSAVGVYTWDDLYVAEQPMENIDEQTALLGQDVMENVKFLNNRITGTIELDSSKMLTFPMAYSKGWSARVDGEEYEVKQVNLMYCGLELPPGSHEIELVYRTPYLSAGCAVSLLSFLVLAVLVLRERRKKNQGIK